MKTKFFYRPPGLLLGLAFLALIYVSMTWIKSAPAPSIERVAATCDYGGTSQYGPAVAPNTALSLSDMTTENPLIPSDIYRNGPSEPPNQLDLATFAWLEFISLSSSKGSVRGTTGGSFANSGKDQSGTLVWESYQHRSELFPYDASKTGKGREPMPWNQTPTYHMYYKDSGKTKALNVPYNNYNNLDEASQIGQNHIFFPATPGTMDPETDHQLLFEAKVNQKSWQFACENYKKFADFNSNYPDGINFSPGTIEVKATWRPLASIPEDQKYRYHTSTVIIYEGEDSDPQPYTEEYALIGLHIIHKTPNYPAFIFATFEQRDNLIDANGRSTGLYYVPTYDYVKYELNDKTTTANPKEVAVNPTYPSGWLNNPMATPSSGHTQNLPDGSVGNIPGAKKISSSPVRYGVPVVQPPTTNTFVEYVNVQARSFMTQIPGFDKNFVWQYYELKGVQSIPTSDEESLDYYLANIVTESSQPGVQLFTGGTSGPKNNTFTNIRNQLNTRDAAQGGKLFNMGGCQGCHGVAQTQGGQDFSFLYFSKTIGFSPDVTEIPHPTVEVERMKSYMSKLSAQSAD